MLCKINCCEATPIGGDSKVTKLSRLVLKYAFLDAWFFNTFAQFHAFDIQSSTTFPSFGMSLSA